MAISGRVPLLLLLGVAAVVLRPSLGTAWLWVLAVAVLTVADLRLAPAPAGLELARRPIAAIRALCATSGNSISLTQAQHGRV
jgi:hypothetical protein